MEKQEIEKWYDRNKDLYGDFVRRMEDLLKTLLEGDGIPYHSVNGRLKEKDHCVEKCDRKEYESPEQIMDLAGLRIITHTTAEVKQVCEMLKREFHIDEKNSGDKSQSMGVNTVGYLSVHYIAQLDEERVKLAEYKRFEGLIFEIQVRSLLQHAWAEIEHDHNYKFAGVLPDEIQRRFHLVAGTLELMDQEFCSLLNEIDAHAKRVQEETKSGNLDIPIDSASLLEFLNDFFKDENPEHLSRNYKGGAALISELHDFGIDTLQQLSDLLKKKASSEWIVDDDSTYFGILRSAMVTEDAERYFGDAWKEHWVYIRKASFEFYKQNGVDFDKLGEIVKVTLEDDGRYYLESVL